MSQLAMSAEPKKVHAFPLVVCRQVPSASSADLTPGIANVLAGDLGNAKRVEPSVRVAACDGPRMVRIPRIVLGDLAKEPTDAAPGH